MTLEVPEGWKPETLGTLCDIRIGGTPARKVPLYWAQDGENGFPWVSIADMKNIEVNKTKEKITQAGINNSNVKLVKAGTVLMSFKLTVGRIAYAGMDLYTNEAIAALEPVSNGEEIDKHFLAYTLPMAVRNAETDQAVKGITLNKSKLTALPILIPPLPEQKKIAEVLSCVDEAIAATKAVIDQTKQVKKGLLQTLLTKGIGHTKFKQTELGEIPESWSLKTIRDISSILGDGLHGTPKYTEDGEYYFINGNNLIDGRIVITEKTKRASHLEYEKNKKDLNDRTVFVSINGTLGNVAFYRGEKVFLGKSACYFNVIDSVDMDFVRCLLINSTFQKYLRDNATGTTIKNVSLKTMREFSFYIPAIDEQREIANIVSAVEYQQISNTLSLERLQTLKSGLMSDLLTGRKRVEV